MDKNELRLIYNLISRMADLFSENVSKDRIAAYVDLLNGYSSKEIAVAIKKCCNECEYFPKLATIVKKINPPEDLQASSNEMAGLIIESIARYGSYGSRQASEALGAIPWRVIEQYGGWRHLCTLQSSEMGTARAQLRELCRAILVRKEYLHLPSKNLLPHQKKEVMKIGELLAQTAKDLIDYKQV